MAEKQKDVSTTFDCDKKQHIFSLLIAATLSVILHTTVFFSTKQYNIQYNKQQNNTINNLY